MMGIVSSRYSKPGLRKLLAVAAILVVVAFLPRLFVYLYASYQKEEMTGHIWTAKTEQEQIERFARWAAGYWQVAGEKDNWNRLRMLPKPFKPDKEPVSFLSGDGWCTEFVRAAEWVIGDRFDLARHDVMAPHRGHSALSLKLSDGRWVFVDPFLGWVFKDGDRLLSLKEVVQGVRAGNPVEKYAVSLKPDADKNFYGNLTETFHAKDFERMDVTIRLPMEGKHRLALGENDGNWEDVQQAGKRRSLSTHLFYVGARYSTKYLFTYSVPDDGRAYDFNLHLTKTPSAEKLPEFSIMPVIDGKILRFRLGPKERTLVMDSSGLRKGRWYPIDRIEVVAAEH